MMILFGHHWPGLVSLLAQEGRGQGDPLTPLLLPMIAIGFLWYFLLFRPQQRERAKRDELLKALKKNDRVVTIGGIIGEIANLSQDGREVTVKVDDNTRLKMLRSSIQGHYGPVKEEPEADRSQKT